MPKMTAHEQNAFLEEPGIIMHIATLRDEHSPMVVPIWFIHRDEKIWFTPRRVSEWLAHIRNNPNVALSITEQLFPYRKVLIEGKAKIEYDLDNDAKWRPLYTDLAKRYVSEIAALAYVNETVDQTRALCSLALVDAKIRSWRMPKEGESYKGIWADHYYTKDAKIRRHESGTSE